MTPIETFLEVADGARKSGSGWSAKCPAHKDSKASLSITEGADGKVLLFCHAGCDFSSIVKAHGLEEGDLFPPKDREGRRIVAEYPYTDEAGVELFQAVRFEPKDFRQRHRGRGCAWTWSLNGARRVLYRLPELQAGVKAGTTVYVVEGEKDVEAIRSLGLVATCNPMGAGKWRGEYAEVLRGAHVVVIADKDEPGRKHAATVEASLRDKASSVHVVEVAEGKDAAAWIALGASREDFERLAEATVEQVAQAGESAASAPAKATAGTQAERPRPVIDRTESDVGNAERFVAQHGELARFCHVWGTWLLYDTRRWRKDETLQVEQLARRTVRAIYAEANEARSEDLRKKLAAHAMRSEQAGRLRAMVSLATSDLPVAPGELDADPWALNVENGTINLKTQDLGPHRREDFLSKVIPVRYDPQARCPTWEAFLERIFSGNAVMIGFVQRAVGYSLTGDTSEQCLFLLHGSGSNGKTTLTEVLRQLGGEYARQADFATFLEREHDGARNDLAALKGARIVTANEADARRAFSESVVKLVTGGDTITARFLFKEFFEFRPEFKLWLAANQRPRIKGTDHAIWRRIKLVPFDVTISDEERDPHMVEKLAAELPGILAWALRGLADWQEKGLAVPAEVKDATAAYRAEEDQVGRFVGDRCILDPQASETVKALFAAYVKWCEAVGEQPVSQKALGQRLDEMGFEEGRTERARLRRGLHLVRERDDA